MGQRRHEGEVKVIKEGEEYVLLEGEKMCGKRQKWRRGHNVTGSQDDHGLCYCSINLPDTYFPADRMELLELANQKLSISVQEEITKIQSYQVTLTDYMTLLKNLTRRVERMEMGGDTYTELDFQLLKLEISDMESLMVKLRASINGSNVLVETLFEEIHNISIIVNLLESYDNNKVLAVRREIASLKKRLEECHKNNTGLPDLLTPVEYGSCKHGGIVNISKPFVVQLNYLGFNYKIGGWGKNSFLGTNQDVHWVAPLNTDARMMNVVRFYPTYNDLLLYKNPTDKVLTIPRDRYYFSTDDFSRCGQGGGVIMFNNSVYYNCYYTRDICKFNVNTNVLERKTLPDAAFNNRFSYASSVYQDIDLASDEEGLWVLYATEQSRGNIMIGKLNGTSLELLETWSTSQYKPGVTNAFMVCGVLYTTRALNIKTEEIFYSYDTKTAKEGSLNIPLEKMMENVQSLSYNANDHKIYMYNDGYLVTYDLYFYQIISTKVNNNIIPSQIISPEVNNNIIPSKIISPKVNNNIIPSQIISPKVYNNIIPAQIITPKVYNNIIPSKIISTNVYNSIILSQIISPKVYNNIIISQINSPKINNNIIPSQINSPKVYNNIVPSQINSPKVYNIIPAQIITPKVYNNIIPSKIISPNVYNSIILSQIISPKVYNNIIPSQIIGPEVYNNTKLFFPKHCFPYINIVIF
ncbi:olfactomedin-4-like [Discoglossus pictus]